jgi:hypothetical protein
MRQGNRRLAAGHDRCTGRLDQRAREARRPKERTSMMPALIGGGAAFGFLSLLAILFYFTVVVPDQERAHSK